MPGKKWLLGLAVLALSILSGCRLCDRYCEREWDDRYGRGRYYGNQNPCCPPPPYCPPGAGGYSYYPSVGPTAFAPQPYNNCCP
jgi:hypothetical protein